MVTMDRTVIFGNRFKPDRILNEPVPPPMTVIWRPVSRENDREPRWPRRCGWPRRHLLNRLSSIYEPSMNRYLCIDACEPCRDFEPCCDACL